MALPLTITGISTAVVPVGPFATSKSGLISQAAGATNWDFGTIGGGAPGGYALGQQFTTPSGGGSLNGVGLKLAKVGTNTDNLVLGIYATAAGLPTGSALATASVAAGALGVGVVTDFIFSSPLTLAGSTVYAFTVARSGTPDNSNYYRLIYNNGDVYAGGQFLANPSGTWLPQATADAMFVLYTTGYYFFGRDSGADATLLRVQKATDPTSSWANVASSAASLNIATLAAYQVGNIIHILMAQTSGTSVTTQYKQFDMGTDTFSVGGWEDVVAGATTAGQTGQQQAGCSIVVRSNGEAVAFFNGLETKTSGTFRARVYYRRRTAVNTWTAAVQVDPNAASDASVPEAVLGTSDSVHLLFQLAANFNQRTLSAANALQTAGAVAASVGLYQALSFDRAGVKVVVSTQGTTTAYYFNSGNTPTYNVGNYTANTINQAPVGLFNDGTDVYALGKRISDSDLYLQKSADNGATWTAVAVGFVGTANGLSRDGNIYQSGLNVVIPYIVNDNGTLKYNEYTVRSLAPPMPELDLTVGAVTVAGPAITLRADRQIDLGVLAVNLSGRDTNGRKGYQITAQKGGVTLAGSTAALRADRRMFPATYSMAVAGKTATLRVGRKLQATAGAITLTGVDVNLRYGRGFMLTTQPGAVTVTGKDVDLIYTPSLITAYVLQAGTGAIGVTPTTAILRYGHVLTAQKGAVAVSGVPINLRRAYTLSPTVGAVTLTGYPATLKYGRAFNFTAGVGAISVSMKSATLRRNRMFSLATGAVTVTGIPADLKVRAFYKLITQPGAIVVTGNSVVLSTRSDKVIGILPGAITVSGVPVTLKPSRALPIVTGAIRLTGYPVILDHHIHMDYTMELAPAAVVVAGQYAELKHGNLQPGQITYGRRAYIPGRW